MQGRPALWGGGLPCSDSEFRRYCPLLKPPLVSECGRERHSSLFWSWPEHHISCWDCGCLVAARLAGGQEVLTKATENQ